MKPIEVDMDETLVIQAARVLIGMTRHVEQVEGARSRKGTIDLEIELEKGGREQWRITIERIASSH